MAECPDEATLLAFMQGRASPEQAAGLHAHVESCAICYELVVLALRSSEATPPDTASLPESERPVAPAAEVVRGASIGRYIVLGVVGRGGMGVVYSAYDPELDRKIALKVLRRRQTTNDEQAHQLQSRLRREAQAMARLSHPNVVTVFDVGMFDGQVFVAMELIEGTTLAAWHAQERPFAEILQHYLAAGRGLAAAHTAGFVHRDFKPENVLIGGDGRVCVTDFGLVRSVDGGAPADAPATFEASLTHAGRLVGTPAYMAPEQLRGGDPVDARADQFSFCVALYEALWRQRPFAGADLDTLLEAIEGGRVRRPSGAVPQKVMRSILRGLSARPDGRFPSMEELLAALTPPPRRMRWPALVAIVASLASLALGHRLATRRPLCQGAQASLAGVWDAARRAQVKERLSGAPPARAGVLLESLDGYARSWAEMDTESCEATRIRGRQSEELFDLRGECLRLRLDELRAVSDILVEGAKKPEDLLTTLTPLAACADERNLRARSPRPKDPKLRKEVESLERRLAESRARVRAGQSRVAFDKELESEAARAYPPLHAGLLEDRGESLVDDGHFDEGVAALERAAAAALACGADELVVTAWSWLAYVSGYVHEHADEAIRWLELATAEAERLRGREDLQVKLLITRAMVDDATKRLDDEDATLRRVMPIADRALPKIDPARDQLLTLQAAVLGQRRQFDAAIAVHRRSIAEEIAARGPDSTELPPKLYNLGLVLEDAHRYDEAQVELEHALALNQKQLPPDHPFIISGLISLGEVHFYKGELARGRELIERALPLADQHLAELPQAAPQARSLLGRIALAERHPRDAIPLLRAALAPAVLDPPLAADAKLALARALLEDHRERSSATALLREARALYAAEDPPDTAALATVDALLRP